VSQQIPVSNDAIVQDDDEGSLHHVAEDVAYLRLAIVNAVVVGRATTENDRWVLVDAGVPGMAGRIRRATAARFGESSKPSAVVLTHGHFDHVGSLEHLAERWDVPIYAHREELPYLTGAKSYRPPDPSVGGGLMALTSPLFPNGPFDFSRWIRPLPDDGSVPGMPGWRWYHTPGHTPGHVSLWRASDRALIAGDAFITTKQASAYAVLTQEAEVHGPPAYYTPDWESAGASVRRLAALEPEVVITGHGRPLHGEAMRRALHLLANDFESIAVPKHGRYVRETGAR
jgi:glyoxylase-like metal-dependent hydrolase (beta-lactamase superfamily II)